MSWEAWLTLAVLVALIGALMSSRVSPVVAVTGATGVLFIAGVIEAEEAFAGFANPAPLTVAALYVIAGAVDKTRALQPALAVLLRPGRKLRPLLAGLLVPAAAGSAFLANTPIVAMLVPPVTAWCRRHGVSASKVLIPLSYATVLGGAVTVIGTSTNLVVSGLVTESGAEPLGLFELARIGLPAALVGVTAIVLLAPILLPDRRSPDEPDGGLREFTVVMAVHPAGPLVGRTVAAAGLRNLQGVFLVEVERAGHLLAPVGPDLVLEADDRLTFVGNVDLVVDLQSLRGLRTATPHEDGGFEELTDDRHHTFCEAVVGASSSLVGRTLADVDFRARFQAAVVAIHRSGQPIPGKLGAVRIRPGDTLLLLAGIDFPRTWRNRDEFLLVAGRGGTSPTASQQAPFTLAVVAGLVALPLLGVLDLFRSALLAAGVLVLGRVLRPREARDSIDLNVVILIGAAFGLGTALRTTGLADRLADGILESVGRFGDVGAIVGLVLVTIVLTELITNAAAVVLAFPIASAIALEIDRDPRIIALGLAVAGSSSFLTPVGYQTNTMVYGPGGYRFTDYLRLGAPLSVLVVGTIVTAVVLQA